MRPTDRAFARRNTFAICLAFLFWSTAASAESTRLILATAAAEPPQELVADLETWLDIHAPWPRRARPAEITFRPGTALLALQGASIRGMGLPLGLYDPATEVIILRDSWSADSLFDVSILLHELIHHRQAAHPWYCPDAQEEPAYRLQVAWLAERGIDWQPDWLPIVLASGCTPRDIHPD